MEHTHAHAHTKWIDNKRLANILGKHQSYEQSVDDMIAAAAATVVVIVSFVYGWTWTNLTYENHPHRISHMAKRHKCTCQFNLNTLTISLMIYIYSHREKFEGFNSLLLFGIYKRTDWPQTGFRFTHTRFKLQLNEIWVGPIGTLINVKDCYSLRCSKWKTKFWKTRIFYAISISEVSMRTVALRKKQKKNRKFRKERKLTSLRVLWWTIFQSVYRTRLNWRQNRPNSAS